METREHLGQKDLAAAWLLSMGCRAVAHEVPCPVRRFVVDAAGYAEHAFAPGADPAAHGSIFEAERAGAAVRSTRTVVVECKASRAATCAWTTCWPSATACWRGSRRSSPS
jgi:hypothetical protein